MLTVYGFGPGFGLSDLSPFVIKVETWLKLAGIDYRKENDISALRNAPKGKLPFIDDNGTVVADSQFIIRHLKDSRDNPLDKWLTPEQSALSMLVGKNLDEYAYWFLVYGRWIDDDVWPRVRDVLFSSLPKPVRVPIAGLIRRGVKKNFVGQGLGKHSHEDILQLARENYGALDVLLGDKPFMLGEQPCSLDAAAYAFCAGVIRAELTTSTGEVAKEFPRLVAYCERVEAVITN